MPPMQDILKTLKEVLEILKEEADATPLSYPINTPASKAFFTLSSLYITLLLGDKHYDD
jgi:hypothetical protein